MATPTPLGAGGKPIGQAKGTISTTRQPVQGPGLPPVGSIPALTHAGAPDAIHQFVGSTAIHSLVTGESPSKPPSGPPAKPGQGGTHKQPPHSNPNPHGKPKPKPKPHVKPKPKPHPKPRPHHKPAPTKKPTGVAHPTNSPAPTPASADFLSGLGQLWPYLLLAAGGVALWWLYTHRKRRG